jgi:hypothetical protein
MAGDHDVKVRLGGMSQISVASCLMMDIEP